MAKSTDVWKKTGNRKIAIHGRDRVRGSDLPGRHLFLLKAKLVRPSRSTTLEKAPILPSLGLVTLPKSRSPAVAVKNEGGKKNCFTRPVDMPLGNAHKRL